MRTSSRAALAALLLPAAAWAQSPGEPGGAEPTLDAVTVTARRSIEQRFFAAGSLVVVDRRDIEQLGAFSVADVLRQLPGVVVTTSGDGSVEIRMRGMDRNATQLLIDGQRVSGGRSQLALDQLPSEVLERIEVVRAPTAQFSGATGGTINIVLRQATAKRETNLRLTDNHVWGRNAPQGFFSRTGPLGGDPPAPSKPVAGEPPVVPEGAPWSYFVAVAATGYILGADTDRAVRESTGSTLTDAATRYRRQEFSLIPRLNGRLGPADQLALRGTYVEGRNNGRYEAGGTSTNAAGASADFVSTEDSRYHRDYLQGAADWTHRFHDSKLETTFSSSRAREGIARTGGTSWPQGTFPTSSYTFDDQRQELLNSLETKLTGTSSAMLWMVGAQLERRELSVANRTSGVPSDLDATVDRGVLWGQNEWEVFNGSTFSAGLRGETQRISSSSGSLVLADRRINFLQPSLHLRTPISEAMQFRVNLARVTRNPRIWDLIDRTIISQGRNSLANPDYVGNPALAPEHSWTLDTGVERRLAGEGQAGLNLFVRRVSDAIATVASFTGSRWVEQRINAGDATVWGLEADVKSGLAWAGLARDWTLSAHASLLQSRMTSGANEGNRIPGQPRYTASVTVAKPLRRTGGFFGGATLGLTGASDFNTSPGITGRERSRAQLDVYVGSVLPTLGYWRVGVFNVTDAPFDRVRNYTDSAGGPGSSSSHTVLTPRLYLTVGTQF